MQTVYNVLLVVAAVLAVLFSALVFFTGKGDAMSSGGGSVRTSFKGKASFDDQISRVTLFMGLGFMALMIVLDVIAHRIF
jgi:preprotein translocase subunit SecG